MADYTRNYDFQSGDVIASSQVDEEFNDIATAIATKPDADGTTQSNLNADMVDGFHAADNGGDGTIPVCSGDVQTNLNAEMVGGLTASDIGTAGFPAGTKMIFNNAASEVPSGWTRVSNPSIDRIIGISSSGTTGSDNSEVWESNDLTIEVNATTLTTAQVPPVSVTSSDAVSSGGAAAGWVTSLTAGGTALTPFILGLTNGGGGSHTHTAAGQIDFDYRPPIRWCMICEKQ